MEPSVACINLIKSFEGLSLRPYLDTARIPTIGYGTIKYPSGKRVTMQDSRITVSEAFSYLMNDVANFAKSIDKLVKVPLTQNQYDAIVSFTYNVGIGALKSSTLLRKLNVNPNDPSIRAEFRKWVRAAGLVIKGLQNRREKEANLYFS